MMWTRTEGRSAETKREIAKKINRQEIGHVPVQ